MAAQIAAKTELEDILYDVQENYRQESDATMRMQILARTEALTELIAEL